MAFLPSCASLLLPLLTRRPTVQASPQPRVGDNTLGALIFFGYILAALYLTSCLLLNIARCYSSLDERPDRTKDYKAKEGQDGEEHVVKDSQDHSWVRQDAKRRGWAYYFAGLALCSFSLLSWNMLNFLIVSYIKWAQSYVDLVDLDWNNLWNGGWSAAVWQWATNSNLFRTFAEDLICHPHTWVYVQFALLYSYAWNLWMGTIGE